MESRLMELLMQDKFAELDQLWQTERAQREIERHAELAQRESERQAELAQREAARAQRAAERHAERAQGIAPAVLLDTMAARFPTAPLALVTIVRELRDPDTLLRLHSAVLQAPDEASAEQAIRDAATLR